jgi:hypothetical protein
MISFAGIAYGVMVIQLLCIITNYRYLRYWAPPMLICFVTLLICYFHGIMFHNFNNTSLIFVIQGGFFIYLGYYLRKEEPRMDYSIFLRLINVSEKEPSDLPPLPPKMFPATIKTLRAFTDFLATDRGVMKDQIKMNSLELWITPVRMNPLIFCGSLGLMKPSKLRLTKDGTVTAHLEKKIKFN